jgi:hypothetical protein
MVCLFPSNDTNKLKTSCLKSAGLLWGSHPECQCLPFTPP